MNIKNKIIIYSVNLLLFVIVALVVYFNVYSKNKNMYNERYVVYERFYNIDKGIDDFAVTQINMDEQENSILEILEPYTDTFLPNSQIVNNYKLKVFTLLKKIEIEVKEKNIVQTQKNDNISLEISFMATYAQLCKFLFELEKFTEVSSISFNYKGETKIKCSPILFSTQVNDCFSDRNTLVDSDDLTKAGYFKEIADKIQEVKNVGYINTWRDFEHIPESPFFYYVEKKKKVTSNVSYANTSKPEFSIDGIMYEKDNSIVIIDGKFYYEGDKYKNARIVKINQNSIKLDCYGTKYTVKMEN